MIIKNLSYPKNSKKQADCLAVRLLFRNFVAKLCTDMTKYPIGIQDFENLRQGGRTKKKNHRI